MHKAQAALTAAFETYQKHFIKLVKSTLNLENALKSTIFTGSEFYKTFNNSLAALFNSPHCKLTSISSRSIVFIY